MHPKRVAAVLLTTIGLVAALAAAPASATDRGGHPGDDHGKAVKLVVNTQFGESSPVVKATGPFRSCTSVQDLHRRRRRPRLHTGVLRDQGGDVRRAAASPSPTGRS